MEFPESLVPQVAVPDRPGSTPMDPITKAIEKVEEIIGHSPHPAIVAVPLGAFVVSNVATSWPWPRAARSTTRWPGSAWRSAWSAPPARS